MNIKIENIASIGWRVPRVRCDANDPFCAGGYKDAPHAESFVTLKSGEEISVSHQDRVLIEGQMRAAARAGRDKSKPAATKHCQCEAPNRALDEFIAAVLTT